jgi:4-hydroxythreonine-4-phosphate dehydrogenase
MLPLALTCGDPGGIGLEIAFAAWSRRKASAIPPFYLIADPALVAERARRGAFEVPLVETDAAGAGAGFARALPVMPLANRLAGAPGRSHRGNAAGIIESIDRAVEDCRFRRAAAVVTLPIAKQALHEAGFSFPGHTEYLAHLDARAGGAAPMPVMMLAGPELRTVPVTVHVALAEVPALLTSDLIADTCRIVARDLRLRFAIGDPRLAVAGLNPHAGENGAFGDEEATVIGPAIGRLEREGIAVSGPLPADTLFHPAARRRYDAAICMYHDQALIPVKTLDFERTVNVTLGLSFVRTSPDHGTAFDIAGTGRASPESLIEALRLAARLAGAGAGAPA